jgi:hypothetical protein
MYCFFDKNFNKLDINITKENSNKIVKKPKKRMSFWTALSLSFKNLLTKKGRTITVLPFLHATYSSYINVLKTKKHIPSLS